MCHCAFSSRFRFSLIYNASATHEPRKCDKRDANATREQHQWLECDTSKTRTSRVRHKRKILILITALAKTYFQPLIFTIWQVKDYKERKNFILGTNFQKCLVSIPKCPKKCATKTKLFNSISYVKTLNTRSQLQIPLQVPAQLRTVTQSHFQSKAFYEKIPTFFLARTIESQVNEYQILKEHLKLREDYVEQRVTLNEILLTSAIICI